MSILVAESGQESWTTNVNNRGLGGLGGGAAGATKGYFKGAIVGVAKHSHMEYPSLNPLLPDILSPRHESEPIPSSLRDGATKMSFQNFGRPLPSAGTGELESKMIPNVHKISAWGEEPINGKLAVSMMA